jgi:hypothetical protein
MKEKTIRGEKYIVQGIKCFFCISLLVVLTVNDSKDGCFPGGGRRDGDSCEVKNSERY